MKLTLDALKERADAVASEELLSTISGGNENDCHSETHPLNDQYNEDGGGNPLTPLGQLLMDWLWD